MTAPTVAIRPESFENEHDHIINPQPTKTFVHEDDTAHVELLMTLNKCFYFITIHAHIGLALTFKCISIDLASPATIAYTISLIFNMIAMGVLMTRPKNSHRKFEAGAAPDTHRISTRAALYALAIASTALTVMSCCVGLVFMFTTRA